jgi:hypothetical protein
MAKLPPQRARNGKTISLMLEEFSYVRSITMKNHDICASLRHTAVLDSLKTDEKIQFSPHIIFSNNTMPNCKNQSRGEKIPGLNVFPLNVFPNSE